MARSLTTAALLAALIILTACFKGWMLDSAHNSADEAQKAANCAKEKAPGSQGAIDAQAAADRAKTAAQAADSLDKHEEDPQTPEESELDAANQELNEINAQLQRAGRAQNPKGESLSSVQGEIKDMEEDIDDDNKALRSKDLSPEKRAKEEKNLSEDTAELERLKDLEAFLQRDALLKKKALAEERKRRAEQVGAVIADIRRKYPKDDPLDAAASEGGKAADAAVQAAATIPSCRGVVQKLRPDAFSFANRDLSGAQGARKGPSGGGGGGRGPGAAPGSAAGPAT